MIVDLHTHTTASDGTLTPESLIQRAQEHGVDVLAITDHDTTSAFPAAIEMGRAAGVKLVTGIEFSCNWQSRNIHIVGLNIDIDCPTIVKAVQLQMKRRESRAKEIGLRLEKKGIEGAYEGAKTYAQGIVGRPHFARYMVEIGCVKDINAAFKQYLGAGKVGDVKLDWPDITEVIDWINSSGGSAVLAHPEKYKLTRTKLVRLASEFKNAGGEAIEVISGKQNADITTKLAQLSKELNLKASCGSDFHSPNQHWQEPGAFGKLPPLCEPVWANWSI